MPLKCENLDMKICAKYTVLIVLTACLLGSPLWSLGEWWEYYSRGEELAAAGQHQAAIDEFTNAIAVENRERKMARTYGVNFIEYYPSREIGIAFYELGEVDDAQRYLERSMKMSPSKRAKQYLDKISAGEVPEPRVSVLAEEPMQEMASTVELGSAEPKLERDLTEMMILDNAESLNLQLVDEGGEVVRSFRYKRQEKSQMRMDGDESSFDIVDEQGQRLESLSLRGGQRPVVRIEEDSSYLDIVDEGGAVLETRALRAGARSVLRSDVGESWVVEVLDNRGQVLGTRTLRSSGRPEMRLSSEDLSGLELDESKLSYNIKVRGKDGQSRTSTGKYRELAVLSGGKNLPVEQADAIARLPEERSDRDWGWIVVSTGGGAVCVACGVALIGFGGRVVRRLTAGLLRTVFLRLFEGVWEALAVVCGMMLFFMGVHLIMGAFGFPLLDFVLYFVGEISQALAWG